MLEFEIRFLSRRSQFIFVLMAKVLGVVREVSVRLEGIV